MKYLMHIRAFYAAVNQNNRKIQTVNKTYRDKILIIDPKQVVHQVFSFRKPFKFWNSIY